MTDLGCLGLIQSQFWLFRHDSMPISAVSAISIASRYSPILAKLVRIETESARIKLSWCKSEKKKKLRCGIDAQAAALDAAPCVRLWCSILPTAPVLHSFYLFAFLSIQPVKLTNSFVPFHPLQPKPFSNLNHP